MLLLILAQDKQIPLEKLVAWGLTEEAGTVLIPYFDDTGTTPLAVRRRTRLKAKEGSYWPRNTQLVPYGLNMIRKINQPWMILVEGESDCWSLWQHDLPALGLPGANTAHCLKLEYLQGIHEIFIHVENDAGGEQFRDGVLARLRALSFAGDVFTFSVTPPHNDVNDMFREPLLDFPKVLQSMLTTATRVDLGPATCGGIPGLVPVSSVKPAEISWLWPGRVPACALTVLDGDPGLGKSTITLDLAARLTRGEPMPFSDPATALPAQRVLLLSGEDDFAAVVRPRLERAGACLDRILVQQSSAVTGQADGVTFPAHLPLLEQTVRQHQIGMVIIDPLMAFFSTGVDTNKDSDVRAVFSQLFRMTTTLQTTVLVVRHLNKGTVGKAIYRGGGSIGILGACRSALLVGRDPEYPEKCLLAVSKSNYAALAPSLRYSINQQKGGPLLNWELETGHEPEELLQARQLHRDLQIDKAVSFLLSYLGDGRFHAVCEIQAEAGKQDLHPKTLCRARDRLSCRVEAPPRVGMTWHWALPLSAAPATPPTPQLPFDNPV